ncbi:MAG: hypothetical protein ACR2GK_13685 [Gemmatimonadaceae bacterium]
MTPISVTDLARGAAAGTVPVLSQVARAAGHELRNSLNALVVNLEVVRSRSSDPAVQPFLEQSVIQSEESVRLAEAAIALLNLVVGAVGPGGQLRYRLTDDGGIRIEAMPGESERTGRALKALADRAGLSVDASDASVILRVRADSGAR